MKVSVLGSGQMGESVIQHLLPSPEVQEITAYDVNAERLQELKDKYGIQVTDDLDQVLSNKAIELVFIASPNHTHKSLAIQCMEAGKAVLCEKPMANTYEDAKELVEKSEELGAFLQIGFECRYSKLYTTVKEWIDAGLLGDVVNTHTNYVSSEFHHKDNWRNKKATGGSMFNEKLCHYVDLPRWWIGSKVKDVISICSPNVIPYYEVRDNYHTTYRFENGAVSHLTFMMIVGAMFQGDPDKNVVDQQQGDGHELRCLIVGTKGAAEVDVFKRSIKRWEFRDGPKCLESHWVDTQYYPAEEEHKYTHNTNDQSLDIVRRVANGLPPMTPARDSLDSMALCFAAELSADTGDIVSIETISL